MLRAEESPEVSLYNAVSILLNRNMSGTRFPVSVHVEGLKPRYEIAKNPDTRNGFFGDASLVHDRQRVDRTRFGPPSLQHVDKGWAGRDASCLFVCRGIGKYL